MLQLESQSSLVKKPDTGISSPRGSDCSSRFSGFFGGNPMKVYKTTEKHRSYQKAYSKTKRGFETQRRASAKYYQSEKGKLCRRIASQNFRKNHPDRTKARSKVNEAIKTGRIPRPDSLQCYRCDNPAKQYHHHLGYRKKHWLDIRAVCVSCHTEIHWNAA